MKILIKNLTKKYHKKIALDNLNLIIENNIYGLMGPNGSGKTTLIKIIVKLLKQNTGTVKYINDTDEEISFDEVKIGYLPQQFNVFKEYTVYEQLEYLSILKNIDKKEYEDDIKYVAKLTNLESELNNKCSELSGGMIRRLGIAQAFLGNPDLVILDEPTVGLDPYERIRFKEIIKEVQKKIPIILSTHIIEDISSLCTNVIMLKDSQILFNGEISDFNAPDNIYVYEVSLENMKFIKEDHVKIRTYDGFRIISNVQMDYPFIKKMDITIDDAYLFICNYY